MNDTLSALLAPTRSMYGADAVAAPAAPQLPATTTEPPSTQPPSAAMMLGGLAIATGVAAGVNALVGSVAYPETKTRQFAAVGALSYAIPAGLLIGATILSRSQAK